MVDREIRTGNFICALLLAGTLLAVLAAPPPASAAKRCFGKKVNRTVGPGQKRVKLKTRDVVWLKSGAKIRAKPYARICAGKGPQVVNAGKGRAWVSTGAGNDVIRLHESSNRNLVQAGGGNDEIHGAKGHDTLDGGPGSDQIFGGGGNDRITDNSGPGNKLFGEEGSDQVSSLGTAVSELHGGNGSDFMYSNGGVTPAGALEKLFGEKGNDRLYADRPDNFGPAYLDGGEGDDWIYGTPGNDVAIFNSGIKKIQMGDGDDLMVASGRGSTTIDAGPGRDTLSFEAATPTIVQDRIWNGIRVRLAAGVAQGFSKYKLSGVEDVIGSAFNDLISGVPGQRNEIRGGLGDDMLFGDDTMMQFEEPRTEFTGVDSPDGDIGDGGLGQNNCMLFSEMTRCHDSSPGSIGGRQAIVSIEKGGILTVLGSSLADSVAVEYDPIAGQYLVKVPGGAAQAGLCFAANADGSAISCPADINSLNGMLIYGGDGDDRIELGASIPSTLTTTLDGGAGKNYIQGGPSKDFISTDRFQQVGEGQYETVVSPGSAGSVLNGGGNLDMIYANDAVTIDGGSGPDGLRVLDPCLGAALAGGDDPDSVVFAGAPAAVKADIAGGFAEWRSGVCPKRTTIGGDIEKLEGTAFDDWLILGDRLPGQQGKSTLLGREGINILDGENGDRNTITTGPAGRDNTVYADPEDKVVWGWGLAAF